MSEYSIKRDPETGLMIVRRDGVKIGQSQTEAAAKIIRRNDRKRREADASRYVAHPPVWPNYIDNPAPRHVCPDPEFHKSECEH